MSKEASHAVESFSPRAERSLDLRHEAALMSPSEAAWLAWCMCAISLAFTALGLLLLVLSRAHHGVPVFEQWVEDALVAVSFSTVGAIVAPRFPPKNPIGWLFCSIGLVAGMLLFSGEYAAYALLARPGSLPGGDVLAWVASWLWVPHVGLYVFLGLLFPDGRLTTPRWRPFAWLVGVAVVVGSAATALSPGPIGGLAAIRNPLGFEDAPNLSDLVEVIMFALTLAAAGSLLMRLRRARDVERQQIKWFAYAATVLAGGATILYVVSDAGNVWWLHWEVGFVATVIGLAGLPVALGIAILKYRLHDIDLIINLTLVYGLLTAVMAGIFEVTVVALQHVLLVLTHEEDSQIAYFATALVMAALFEPLKRRVDAFVERRFFRRSNQVGQ
ncbi:MAG: hypothetical protein M3441_22350 [Chloroflexota bacterium]|jgi:hypothetical protein|nr:hypothetical protein [Chloroflexota bacterium]